MGGLLMKKIFFNLLLTMIVFSINISSANASVIKNNKKQQFERTFYKELEESNIIKNSDNIEFRFLNTSTQNTNNHLLKINDARELVSLLEKQELDMNSISSNEENIDFNSIETISSLMKAKGKSKTISASGTRGITFKIKLRADITYNTSTNKISKVSNRKLTLSGLTVAVKVEDRTYKTTYSSTKKTCTVRCDYSEIIEAITPVGAMEIIRHDAYQQFKWSKSKGTYGIKGGYV